MKQPKPNYHAKKDYSATGLYLRSNMNWNDASKSDGNKVLNRNSLILFHVSAWVHGEPGQVEEQDKGQAKRK